MADGKPVEASTGKPATLLADAEDTGANSRLRRVVESALAVLKRVSPGRAVRAAAITELKDQVDEGKLGPIDKATTTETDPELKASLQLLRAAVRISSSGPAKRPAAAAALSGSHSPDARSLRRQKLRTEPDATVKTVIQAALDSVQGQRVRGERLGPLFTGLSLGSTLLWVAPGLATTDGLMGVINMAHGELMMTGAYAT